MIKCCKCSVELEHVDDINIKYGIMPLPNAKGYRCPCCKAELLPKKLILEDMAEAEKMLVGK